MNEEWKDIKGYEGRYQVSNLGRVKSLNYNHTKKEKILKLKPNRKGYFEVFLYKNGERRAFKVHRLVALHFIPNPNNYPQVNHKDENKQSNCVDNLEWCTNKYNMNYGTRSKRASESMKGKYEGSKNPQARKVQCVTTGKKFNCIKEASEYYYIKSFNNITHCCQGKYKYCGKHPVTGEELKWKYID